jgi:hypothetical protein
MQTPLAQQLLDAVAAHNYTLLVVLSLVGSVWAVRAGMPYLHGKFGAALNSDIGGTILVLVGSTAGALATTLKAGGKLTPQLVLATLLTAASASGIWNMGKSVGKRLGLIRSKAPTKAADTVTPTDPPKAALFIPFLLLCSITLSGCPWGTCELAKLPQTAIQAVACVTAALASPSDMTEDVVTADIQACAPLAKGQLDCAVAALTKNAEQTVAMKYKGAAAPARALLFISRGKAWLAKHPSACYDMTKDKLVQRLAVFQ